MNDTHSQTSSGSDSSSEPNPSNPDQDSAHLRIRLEPVSTRQLAELTGPLNQNLSQIEQRLQVTIRNRGNDFSIGGPALRAQAAASVLQELYEEAATRQIDPEFVHLHLQQSHWEQSAEACAGENVEDMMMLRTKRIMVKPRGRNQIRYVKMIQERDISFGVGPAGTGKTWLAVACAVSALEQDQVRRILLVRPAVEAGEKLGFLPGDLAQKIDPYLRPLYDALYEMLGFETVGKLIERNIIEVAPLAYMRGRTLNDSFIILDEAQNTTKAQMKMFLTRIGFGSTAIITGDLSQIDLPRDTASGLAHAVKVLERIKDIGFVHFDSKDVVRHALVQRIVDAYDHFESAETHNSAAGKKRKP